MRMFVVCLVLLATLAACESKASKVQRLREQYDAEYPAYAKECLDPETAGSGDLLAEKKLTQEELATLEAKKKELEAWCNPQADHLADLQRQILAAQQ